MSRLNLGADEFGGDFENWTLEEMEEFLVNGDWGDKSNEFIKLFMTWLVWKLQQHADQVMNAVQSGVVNYGEWMTPSEAAFVLGVSARHVTKLCRDDVIDGTKIRGAGRKGKWRIRRDEVLRYKGEGNRKAS